jgi:hypothetical protein
MGLLQNPAFKQLLHILTDMNEHEKEDRDKMARDIVIENALRSGVLFDAKNHADIAAIMKVDIPEVQRLAALHKRPKLEPVEEKRKVEKDPDWTPPQSVKMSMKIKRESPIVRSGWNTRSSVNRQPATGNWQPDSTSEGPPAKRRRGFSYETTSLLNIAWNTQVILKQEFHAVIATLADITVKQLKTWFLHKKDRNHEILQPVAMGEPGSKRFSEQQVAILTRAFERNLLTGENLAVIAELVQINEKQIHTWVSHRKHRGPTTK